MRVIAVILLLVSSTGAYANCSLDGQNYPTGAVKDGYICGSDGYWKQA